MKKPPSPKGNENREAIASLGGYVYQIYQSALAWLELDENEFLFLEVAEDYVVAAKEALEAVQVKATYNHVTINSDDIIASINSFVVLRTKNPQIKINLRHLTTSQIGKEKSNRDRFGETPTLELWRNLARIGDVSPLREILRRSKLSKEAKSFVENLDDEDFREEFLKRIHFDCGAPEIRFLRQQLEAKLIKALQERGGVASQASDCMNNVLVHLLHKSIQKQDRFVDRSVLENLLETATHIPINRAQLDAQNKLIARALSASLPKSNDIISARLAHPRPIGDVPLPSAIAQRPIYIDNIVSSLGGCGVGWIAGAAGVGKTVAAKLAALRLGGNWATVNLRGLSTEQVGELLYEISIIIQRERNVQGLLIDDLESNLEDYVIDRFLNLLSVCNRLDLLLLVTAPRSPATDLLFFANLPSTIETRLDDFTEDDVSQILNQLGVTNRNWAKYVHLVSAGHPQLVVATVQSMARSGWDAGEFRTLNSLLVGNSEVDQVRARTRERLLKELPDGSRRLLERLSLAPRGFKRNLVLDLAQVNPSVSDSGIFFDQLIGSWIDQHEKDRFSLSPLLSNYASSALTDAQRQEIHFEIAKSLIRPGRLDPIEANAALLAAWIGQNEEVILRLSLSIIGSDASDLRMISPHFLTLTHMRTDKLAYERNAAVNQMLRGAQLIVLSYGEAKLDRFQKALEAFERETASLPHGPPRAGMALVIYSKLLLSEPVFGPIPRFEVLSTRLNTILENKDDELPNDLIDELEHRAGLSMAIGIMFLNQARQLKLIGDLVSVFDFLAANSESFRARIFAVFDKSDVPLDPDMMVSGAWLHEHEADTIDPKAHSSAYGYMEGLAEGWGRRDLAVACRKYSAVILDEYGADKEAALRILDEGLHRYGATTSELIRAKAKVLHRANEHQASLELSRQLIDGDLSLSETEKAFLGREAAISAEKQGDLETARRYYLFGATAAQKSGVPDMVPMHIGLIADAALASWHAGHRETCLRDLTHVMDKLDTLDPNTSLRAAHCHAISRHVLLWLDQEASGEPHYMADGELPKIYPGLVSNPEPHSKIGERYLPPLEISWYMLAQVECHCLLDIGIMRNLETHLTKGPVREGQMLLTQAKLDKAFRTKDVRLFLEALIETIQEFAFVGKQGGYKENFDIENITYGRFPPLTTDDIKTYSDIAEQQILTFCAISLFDRDVNVFDNLLLNLKHSDGFSVRSEFLSNLANAEGGADYNSDFGNLLSLLRKEIDHSAILSPKQVFEITFKALQVSKVVRQLRYVSGCTLLWLNERWTFVWAQQRFLLRRPAAHETLITDAWSRPNASPYSKILSVLTAILPTIGISNEAEVERLLKQTLDGS